MMKIHEMITHPSPLALTEIIIAALKWQIKVEQRKNL